MAYVSRCRGRKQFNSDKQEIQREESAPLWMNTNPSVSLCSAVQLHPALSAYRWLPFWCDGEALICVSRSNPCSSVLVSSFLSSLLVVCCMSQIFPWLWSETPGVIAIIVYFHSHLAFSSSLWWDGGGQMETLSWTLMKRSPLDKITNSLREISRM